MNPPSGDDFDHPWLIERIPEEILGRYRRAMFRVRSSNEPLVILDSLAEMQEVLQQVERAAVEEARAQGATWSQVAEALNRTRQAVEQRFHRPVTPEVARFESRRSVLASACKLALSVAWMGAPALNHTSATQAGL